MRLDKDLAIYLQLGNIRISWLLNQTARSSIDFCRRLKYYPKLIQRVL